MCGWFSFPAARASSRKRSTKSRLRASRGESTLTATTRSSSFWRALNTLPIPPWPIFSTSSKPPSSRGTRVAVLLDAMAWWSRSTCASPSTPRLTSSSGADDAPPSASTSRSASSTSSACSRPISPLATAKRRNSSSRGVGIACCLLLQPCPTGHSNTPGGQHHAPLQLTSPAALRYQKVGRGVKPTTTSGVGAPAVPPGLEAVGVGWGTVVGACAAQPSRGAAIRRACTS